MSAGMLAMLPGLAADEQVAAQPGIAADQRRAVAQLRIELAPARPQRHRAQRVGRELRRIIVGRRQHHREAAMLDPQRLGEPAGRASRGSRGCRPWRDRTHRRRSRTCRRRNRSSRGAPSACRSIRRRNRAAPRHRGTASSIRRRRARRHAAAEQGLLLVEAADAEREPIAAEGLVRGDASRSDRASPSRWSERPARRCRSRRRR